MEGVFSDNNGRRQAVVVRVPPLHLVQTEAMGIAYDTRFVTLNMENISSSNKRKKKCFQDDSLCANESQRERLQDGTVRDDEKTGQESPVWRV